MYRERERGNVSVTATEITVLSILTTKPSGQLSFTCFPIL